MGVKSIVRILKSQYLDDIGELLHVSDIRRTYSDLPDELAQINVAIANGNIPTRERLVNLRANLGRAYQTTFLVYNALLRSESSRETLEICTNLDPMQLLKKNGMDADQV